LSTFGAGCCRFEPCPPSNERPGRAGFQLKMQGRAGVRARVAPGHHHRQQAVPVKEARGQRVADDGPTGRLEADGDRGSICRRVTAPGAHHHPCISVELTSQRFPAAPPDASPNRTASWCGHRSDTSSPGTPDMTPHGCSAPTGSANPRSPTKPSSHARTTSSPASAPTPGRSPPPPARRPQCAGTTGFAGQRWGVVRDCPTACNQA
jgi:hypothetical protein